jgi:hypothetical protein
MVGAPTVVLKRRSGFDVIDARLLTVVMVAVVRVLVRVMLLAVAGRVLAAVVVAVGVVVLVLVRVRVVWVLEEDSNGIPASEAQFIATPTTTPTNPTTARNTISWEHCVPAKHPSLQQASQELQLSEQQVHHSSSSQQLQLSAQQHALSPVLRTDMESNVGRGTSAAGGLRVKASVDHRK